MTPFLPLLLLLLLTVVLCVCPLSLLLHSIACDKLTHKWDEISGTKECRRRSCNLIPARCTVRSVLPAVCSGGECLRCWPEMVNLSPFWINLSWHVHLKSVVSLFSLSFNLVSLSILHDFPFWPFQFGCLKCWGHSNTFTHKNVLILSPIYLPILSHPRHLVL